jgi:uncharacterized protein (DUF3084 family)
MLTDEQIAKIASTPCAVVGSYVHTFARSIEAAATEPLLERIAQKQSRIDQLLQEVAAGADAEATQRERIAGLERQLEQAQKDAARYRWLRDSKIEDDAQEWLCAGVFDMGGVVEIDGEALDQAIDAAIQSKVKP